MFIDAIRFFFCLILTAVLTFKRLRGAGVGIAMAPASVVRTDVVATVDTSEIYFGEVGVGSVGGGGDDSAAVGAIFRIL